MVFSSVYMCPSALICYECVQFQIEKQKLAVVVHVLQTTVDFGHFTLLFCRGRQRNIQRVITHVHSQFCAH